MATEGEMSDELKLRTAENNLLHRENEKLRAELEAAKRMSPDDRAALDLGRAAMAAVPEKAREALGRAAYKSRKTVVRWDEIGESGREVWRDAGESVARYVVAALMSERGVSAGLDETTDPSLTNVRNVIAAAARATLGEDVVVP